MKKIFNFLITRNFMMKEEIAKKNDIISEMIAEFQENPLYQTLNAVTELLGDPTKFIKDFSYESSDEFVLSAGIDEIGIFIADCEDWSDKLKIRVDEAVKNEAFSENPFFNLLFFDTLPKVIALLKSVSQPMFLPCESARLPLFAITIKKLNDFFEACVPLESKLERLVEDFKRAQAKKQLFGNDLN